MQNGLLRKTWDVISMPFSVAGIARHYEEKEAAETSSPEQGQRQWFNHIIRNALTYDAGPVSLEDDGWLIEKFEAELERCHLEKSIAQEMLTHFRSLPEEMDRSVEEAKERANGYDNIFGRIRGLYSAAASRIEHEQWQKQAMEEFMQALECRNSRTTDAALPAPVG
jgi:hypothetical protein